MSSSDGNPLTPDEIQTLGDLCLRLNEGAQHGGCREIPEELVTALLTSATNVYRFSTLEDGRRIPPFVDDAQMTATSVVVVASAMLKAVGLNPFDLAMWFNRPAE